MDELAIKDRLLLTFANLASYSIVAETALPGGLDVAQAWTRAKARHLYPYSPEAWVFWLAEDDRAAFDRQGHLIETLPLHVGAVEVFPALRTALLATGITSFARDDFVLGVVP